MWGYRGVNDYVGVMCGGTGGYIWCGCDVWGYRGVHDYVGVMCGGTYDVGVMCGGT